MTQTCTAFSGTNLIASGPLAEVALTVKSADAPQVLVFDDRTGAVIDLDLRGSNEEIAARYAPAPEDAAPRKRGRPKLGVVAREVTLLPRHWDWLQGQPGGASATLRRLVETARQQDSGATAARAARDAAYRFMSAIGGDLPGFEDAARALFAGDMDGFARQIADWPADIAAHAQRLAVGPGATEKDAQ
ncbi:DUF2239 family protein [Thalassovita mangrovi]|uniref:DUF2239 family protein n=1 Tax=Thalassovita mangrovi TaxID=2692236 RepID=A0A6L8LPS8_9RHOB|nr:DUF2239 family protein [Thalassovita mangrovi]MYM55159.1 DUF2239 family protein [Thalassovita mangrovi]